jgi:2-methylisocitrate lyase-like PEP mutase family enzyme
MNVDKAIKNLKAGRKDCGMIPPEKYTATIDLAVEALKAVQYVRRNFPAVLVAKLPGETEE